jgi:hypothetical protein
MVVVPRCQIVLTGGMSPAQNCVHVVQRRLLALLRDPANLDFDLAPIRQINLLRRSKNAIFVNCVNCHVLLDPTRFELTIQPIVAG